MLDANQIIKAATSAINSEIDGLIKIRDSISTYNKTKLLVAIEYLMNCSGKVIVTGIGKSGHMARKIASTFASTGTPAFFMHPAEALHGDLGMITPDDVVIAISYSGQADELLTIIPILKRQKIKIIAMTGKINSTLASYGDCVFDISIDKEACPLGLAPTTSTTVTLALGDAIAVSLLTVRGFNKSDFAMSHPGGELGRKLLTYACDIMHKDNHLPIVYTDTLFKDVVIEISNKRLGMAAVIDRKANNNIPIGIITDGDLRRIFEHNLETKTITALDIMSKNPKTIKQDDLAITAIDMMQNNQITGFLVVDSNTQALVGAFNLHDLLRAKLL